jgi:hypothetical protein
MDSRNTHGRIGMGTCNVVGARLAPINTAVENIPAILENRVLIFMFSPFLSPITTSTV